MSQTRPGAHDTAGARRLGRRQRRLRRALAVLAGAAVVSAALLVVRAMRARPQQYRPGEDHPEITRTLEREIPPDAPRPRFEEVARQVGLGDYEPFRGARSSQLPEDMGPGAAWGDYDNDGDEDLFLVSAGGALGRPPAERAPSLLYENLGDGAFRRVEAFPDTRIIGMGAAWGDYDGDGWLDLAVSGYQSLILFHNDRGSLRRDESFPEPPGYWAGVSWGDFDNDHDLDLYVCGYVQYAEAGAGTARVSQQYGYAVPYTLNPASFRPQPNLLFRNDGAGAFTEVAGELGVANPDGRSLGALWHDFNDDGWLDLYIANDISDNVLYLNRHGRFEDVSHAAWVADYRGAMGLAAADWNRDGDDDLFVSHWVAQENALYDSLMVDFANRSADPQRSGHGPERAAAEAPDGTPSPGRNVPPGAEKAEGQAANDVPRFMDTADARGLGYIALQFVGWGAEFADFDGDGWIDLAVANGSTFETEEKPPRLRSQEPFLFWNRKGERFDNLAVLSEPLSRPRVARGLALADYDNDGDVDILIVCRQSGALLFRNDMQDGNWIEIRLRGLVGEPHRVRGFGDGTKLVAHVDGAVQSRTIGGASYLSQSSRVAHFGLGAAAGIDDLEVRWLGGKTTHYAGLAAGAVYELREGEPGPKQVKGPPAVGQGREDRSRVVQFWEHQRAAMHAMKVEGNLERAVEEFEAALAIDPTHEDSRYYLGNCLAAFGKIDAALAQFEELTRMNPRGSRGYRRWGTLLALNAGSRTDLERARTKVEAALAINPEETGSLQALAEIEILLGMFDDADRRLVWIGRTNPRSAASFYLRGYIAWSRGDSAAAEQFLRQAREALGPEWKPEGATAEGDVERRLHSERTPLSQFLERWDGSEDPALSFAALDSHLVAARRLS